MAHPPTPGALFVVSGRAYVDSQTLHNLARTRTITPIAGGWRVLGHGGSVECALTSRPALPEQRGSLYEARSGAGMKVRDACASWLAEGSARLAGKFDDWPGAEACGCGPTCGCGPCKQRHNHAEMSAGNSSPPRHRNGKSHAPQTVGKVSDEDAAQHMIDSVPFELGGYKPETTARQPSGFSLDLYAEDDDDYNHSLVTFEVIDQNTTLTTWHSETLPIHERRRILRVILPLILEAYDPTEHQP